MPADQLQLIHFVIVILCLLIAVGLFTVVVRLVMKPIVLLGLIGLLGWIMYFTTIA